MGKTLQEIARTLKNSDKKVQLIYAFNGVGKTRLSREFKELVASKGGDQEDGGPVKVLYYNAFTEDLFYWDNDLDGDRDRKLIIQPNGFTDWVFKDQGQEHNVITHFQHYTNDKLTPRFNEDFNEVTFSIEAGNNEVVDNIKISKGEESCLVWCIFYSLLEQVVDVLNVPEASERENDQFDDLEYVFIDDPVSSLDDNHLIELAVNIADLIKSSGSEIKFVITTHNPLFYNILFNELKNDNKKTGYKKSDCVNRRLERLEDGTYQIVKCNDSPFSYHLFLLAELKDVIQSGYGHKNEASNGVNVGRRLNWLTASAMRG